MATVSGGAPPHFHHWLWKKKKLTRKNDEIYRCLWLRNSELHQMEWVNSQSRRSSQWSGKLQCDAKLSCGGILCYTESVTDGLSYGPTGQWLRPSPYNVPPIHVATHWIEAAESVTAGHEWWWLMSPVAHTFLAAASVGLHLLIWVRWKIPLTCDCEHMSRNCNSTVLKDAWCQGFQSLVTNEMWSQNSCCVILCCRVASG